MLPNRRFEFLDGLRGIAALLVVFYHFNNILIVNGIIPFHDAINWMLAQGEFGVEIFFVLSGFVIAYSIRNDRISLGFASNFFVKRSIRLDPPYWVTLLLLISLTFAGNLFKTLAHPMPSFDAIMFNAFYMADIMDIPRILPVSWTLALEIQFYLFFIMLVSCLQFMSARYSKDNVNEAMSMPALFVLTALMSVSLLQNTSYTLLPSVQGVFVYKWYSFFIGCAACWTMLKIVPSGFFWINLSLIGVYAVAVSSGAYATCLVALVIFGVAMKDKMHNFLTSFAFQYLGRISYSLYLLHWAVGLKIIDNGLRISGIFENNLAALLVLLVIALGASVLAADVFYRFIEMPSLSLSRHFKRRSHLMAHADRSQGECT